MAAIPIYTGLWINHSRNIFIGATLTLNTKDGAILIAFLATLVTVAGSSAWRLLKYTLHQARSNKKSHDALFYQQQAILKNSSSALGSAITFLRVSWAWRKHERRKIWKSWTLLFVLLAIILSTLFTTAAIFSSQVTQGAGVAFLIRSPSCGTWNFNVDNLPAQEIKLLNDSHAAENYARTCYNGGSGNSRLCDNYKVADIKWTADLNSSCPFADRACDNFSSPMSMDTGYLDSHEVFGLNAIPSERVIVRKKVTCSILGLRHWASAITQTLGAELVEDTFLAISIGKLYKNDSSIRSNYTYTWNAHNLLVERGYDLKTRFASAGTYNSWQPIVEFNRTDADVTIIFLAQNGIFYAYPTNDSLFTALRPAGSASFFFPDRPVTGVGCVDQYQICNPIPTSSGLGTMKCTRLNGIVGTYNAINGIDLNEYQLSTLKPIQNALQYVGMDRVADGRDSSVLKAQETVYALEQTAKLPDNQWQLELLSWNAVTLARLQAAVVEYATGPKNIVENGGTIIGPNPIDKIGRAICNRQMVLNVNGYQNFSTLGISIIIIFCTCLILLSWTIDILIGLIQKYSNNHYKRMSWIQDGYLHLQRMAYEGAGYVDWEGRCDNVPRTRERGREGQIFSGLDLEDLDHPKILPRGRVNPPLLGKDHRVEIQDMRSICWDSPNRVSTNH